MTPHPWLDTQLLAMSDVEVRRGSIWSRGRFSRARRLIQIRHGLRGPAYFAAVAHELIHAERGDQPCAHPVSEAQQELAVAKEASRRLIDIHRLADVAAAYPDDPHRIAEELDVDYETLALRVKYLHPSERHLLRRRLLDLEPE